MSQKIRLILSFFLSIGFLLFSYWVTNLQFPISGEKAVLGRWETLRGYFWPRERMVTDSVLFVNVAYDKVLIPANDEYRMPMGRKQITDRQKLLQMLQYLKKHNNYKYILLDVIFGDDVSTPRDKELFSTILSMSRMSIPCHGDEVLADRRLMEKAGLADYLTSFSEVDFVKYPYLSDTLKSMPLRMYEDVTGRSINEYGFFFFDGWRLARKSIVLKFDLLADAAYADNGEKIWYNLGTDLLGDSIPEMNYIGDAELYTNPQLTKNKYIVIGAFKGDDTHKTYMGENSGAAINFNAFVSLKEGHHLVSVSLCVILFIVFFILSYLTISKRQLVDILQDASLHYKSKYVHLAIKIGIKLCTWIGYSLFLTFMCIATYVVLGEVYDIFITSTAFYVLGKLVTLTEKFNKKYALWKIKKQ